MQNQNQNQDQNEKQYKKNFGVIKIHSPSPYENINEDTRECLKKLKEAWPLWKKSPAFSQILFNYFSTLEEPFKSVLHLMVSCGDFNSGKCNSLSFSILSNFSEWVETQNIVSVPKLLKLDALNLISDHKSLVFKDLLIRTFRLDDDKEILANVRELAGKKKYREACQLAVLLKLHKHFGIEEFLVPLIFQEKFNVACSFLNNSKQHQLDLAMFLDEIFGSPNVTQKCLSIAENLGIPNVKKNFVKYKTLSNILKKMIKMYEIPSETCVNLNNKKKIGIIQFLLQKRYKERSISRESWVEMLLEVTGDEGALHVEVVRGLAAYGDVREALWWAERFGVPQELWPKRLLLSRDAGVSTDDRRQGTWKGEEAVNNENDNLKYYKFPLEESQIKMIDTAEGFNDFLADITNGVSIVGIDAEWKPSFWGNQNDVALMQIATKETVYILDVMGLRSAAPASLWERLANFLFDNPNVVKVGFDTKNDLHMLQDVFQKVHRLGSSFYCGFLDLAALQRVLMRKYKFSFPFVPGNTRSNNLSTLIQMCLGKALDKSDQFSNWEKRPLRKSQILYAAIDAYCLLEAYNVIVKESKSQGIPIYNVIENILYGKLDINNKNQGRKSKKRNPVRKTINQAKPSK